MQKHRECSRCLGPAMPRFAQVLADLATGLEGDLADQAKLLRARLVDHGFSDPRRLVALGEDGEQDILDDVFGGAAVSYVIIERFTELWAAAEREARRAHSLRYPHFSEAFTDFVVNEGKVPAYQLNFFIRARVWLQTGC